MEFTKHQSTQLSASFFIIILLIFISCDKKHEISNNSYKGYGFFYTYLHRQDGRYELHFIPVNSSREELINLRSNLKTERGLSFSSFGGEANIKEVFKNAKMIELKNREKLCYESQNILYAPVYIEFEETKNDKDKKYPKRGYTDILTFSKEQSCNIVYDPTQMNILELITINKLEILKN